MCAALIPPENKLEPDTASETCGDWFDDRGCNTKGIYSVYSKDRRYDESLIRIIIRNISVGLFFFGELVKLSKLAARIGAYRGCITL